MLFRSGTWCGTLGAISGANLTGIVASSLNLNAYCSVGVGGLNASSTGYNNIAIGYCSLIANTTGAFSANAISTITVLYGSNSIAATANLTYLKIVTM